ncbi:MAG: FxSxx-COOH system tetratricopeptide repeat protein [Pseudonocardiaceae bacterium]
MAGAAGSGLLWGRRWAVSAFAFLAALSVAALAVVTNLATAVVPDSLPWLKDGKILWPAVGVLALLSAVLATRAARQSRGATSLGTSISAGVGSVVVVASHSAVTVPEPPPAAKPGQLVLGELPGAPPSCQQRPELAQLTEVFTAGHRVAVVCAVTGARGVGKTQLAADYARRRAAEGCPLVAWVSAGTGGGCVGGLAEVARAVGVADSEGDSTASAVNLRAHLQTRDEPALLVIDNAADVEELAPLLPVVGPTQVIITSTDQVFRQLGAAIEVSVFDRDQSLTYLHARTGLEDREGADRVAEELGDLPLALAQAATVIQLHQLGYPDYLTRLRGLPVTDVLIRQRGDAYPKGAAEAILLSVRAVEDTDESGLTRRLLTVIAVLSPTGVHRAVLLEILKLGGGDTAYPVTRAWRSLRRVVSARATRASGTIPGVASVDEALSLLVGLSLLGWGQSGTSVILHRLIGRVIRDRLQTAGALATTISDVVQALRLLQIPEEQAWARREFGAELVGHAVAVWDIALAHTGGDRLTPQQVAPCADMVNWAVRLLTVTADLSRATRIGAQVLGDCVRVLGPDHPDTLTSRNNLASAYQSAGRLEQAIPLFEATLTERERVLGPDHPHTLGSRNNLAGAYESAGRLEQAIPLYEATLTDIERVLGPDHPDALTSRNNLAYAYQAAGRLEQAIPLHEATLTDTERVLGPDHPNALTSRNNLALAYKSAGRLEQAIPLYEATLTDIERVLGPDHPNTLNSRNNLASAYQAVGRLEQAIPLLEATLTERERVLGPDHPNTLTSRNNLAGAYESAGRLEQAIPLYEATLTDTERVLGPDHPTTRTVRDNLRLAQGK